VDVPANITTLATTAVFATAKNKNLDTVTSQLVVLDFHFKKLN
jgi:hypothetical protein